MSRMKLNMAFVFHFLIVGVCFFLLLCPIHHTIQKGFGVLFELCLLQYRHEFIFNLQIQLSLQYDFNILKDWILDNKSVLSETKSYVMIFGSRQKLQSKSCLCAIL